MAVYYNEIDPFCCEWLRQLIKRGLLPDGEIDSRSIEDVKPDDLCGFTQCHFFAGIGGWPYALRLAGWPEDRQIWTGSCPCQPFSAAGKRTGTSDERHLWPSFFWLISQCRPDTVIGEQVASKDALAWFDLVRLDMEGACYACGVQDTCAAGYGAPHIRQRLYWVANSEQFGWRGRHNGDASQLRREVQVEGRSAFDGMGNAVNEGLERYARDGGSDSGQDAAGSITASGESDGVVYPNGSGRNRGIFPQASGTDGQASQSATDGGVGVTRAMPTNGFWSNPDWLWCRDKKWRPIKSGLGPLVDRTSERMGRGRDCRAIRQRLKGYGNSIVVPQGVEFIKAVMEVLC